MLSTLKIKTESKCRYNDLACQLLAGGTNMYHCKTNEEVDELNKKYIQLAKQFIKHIERVSSPSGEIKA